MSAYYDERPTVRLSPGNDKKLRSLRHRAAGRMSKSALANLAIEHGLAWIEQNFPQKIRPNGQTL